MIVLGRSQIASWLFRGDDRRGGKFFASLLVGRDHRCQENGSGLRSYSYGDSRFRANSRFGFRTTSCGLTVVPPKGDPT